MARRFDQNYRVKPRDNLGDPEYWNRRFEDLDRRISSNEDGLDTIGGLTAYVEGLALNRLDLVLAPALDKIALVSEQGFLIAHSNTVNTLSTNTSQTFLIQDATERDLFAPSPFVTICRQANDTDYAFAQCLSYDKTTGALVLKPMEIIGSVGPFNDWVIYVGTAIPEAALNALTGAQSARTDAQSARDAAAASAAAALQSKNDSVSLKNDTLSARDAAAASAAAAATFDPASFIRKDSTGTYADTITFTKSPIVPTPTAGDNTTKAASTAFVTAAINALINGAPGALDTLKELADAINDDAAFSATVTTALSNRLRFDASQTLSAAQAQVARANVLALGRKMTTTFINSGSGTYNPPVGCIAIRVRAIGAGGGGGGGSNSQGGSGQGGAGGTTTFGSITCPGGQGGAGAGGGSVSGGIASGGDVNMVGAMGINSTGAGTGSTGWPQGAPGAASVFGSGGTPGWPSADGGSSWVYGAGGGGGGGYAQGGGYGGGGGAAGGYAEKCILNPTATAYAIGANGTAGGAGPYGASGGNGGIGCIIIEEYYA
ncbi:hypothetical protein [Bradyrhizobium sp. SZCCHNS3053]|uniref:hypothetical protein n=1 Tax=Bradyrhizobium sp. SZCCHNS3053 TaxID=3057322 RepID=UPI00291626C0|nr:hypothetical protein [Bradyrhizobium sp. SZCCHNS3053]